MKPELISRKLIISFGMLKPKLTNNCIVSYFLLGVSKLYLIKVTEFEKKQIKHKIKSTRRDPSETKIK